MRLFLITIPGQLDKGCVILGKASLTTIIWMVTAQQEPFRIHPNTRLGIPETRVRYDGLDRLTTCEDYVKQ